MKNKEIIGLGGQKVVIKTTPILESDLGKQEAKNKIGGKTIYSQIPPRNLQPSLDPIRNYKSYKEGVAYSNQRFFKYGHNRSLWKWIQLNLYNERQNKLFKILGLPNEIDEYYFNYLLQTEGWLTLVNYEKKWYACQIAYQEIPDANGTKKVYSLQEYDNLPTYIKIQSNEAKLQGLIGKNLKVGVNCFVIRNNYYLYSNFMLIWRLISDNEKLLYQIEMLTMDIGSKFLHLPNNEAVYATMNDQGALQQRSKYFGSEQRHLSILNEDIIKAWRDGKSAPFYNMESTDTSASLINMKDQISSMICKALGITNTQSNAINTSQDRLLHKQQEAIELEAKLTRQSILDIRNNDMKKVIGLNLRCELSELVQEQEKEEETKNENSPI